MALTGKLLGDFSSFVDAVAKADTSLKNFQGNAGKVQDALNKMGDSFSGRKIITDAELATKAVTDIGGATKLTEAEQARLNATLTEALAKYKVLGQQAPEAMVQLAAQTKQVETAMAAIPKQTTNILGGLGSLASAIGIGFSIGAVVNFGKSVFDSASKIHDLAEQMGISTDAVQGFKFAAEQAGSSLDTVGTALTKMNEKLAIGDKSTINALKDAGLSFQEIRNMKPEDAFLAITDAVAKIADPMKQAEVAVALFGKRGAELLPAIQEGFRGVANSADKMKSETIKHLDDMEDAWGKLKDKLVIHSGEMIVATQNAVTEMTSSWKGFFKYLSGPGAGFAFPMNVGPVKPPDINLPSETPAASGHFKTKEELDAEAEAAKKYAKALQDIREATIPLTDAEAYRIVQLHKLGVSEETIATALHVSGAAVKTYLENLENARVVAKAFEDAQTDMGKAARGLVSNLMAASKANQNSLASLSSDVQDKMLADLVKFHEKNKLANMNDHDASIAIIQDQADKTLDIYRQLAGEANPIFQQLSKEVGEDVSNSFQKLAQKEAEAAIGVDAFAKKATVNFGDLAQSLSQLAQIAGTTFGGMASGLATLVGSANTAKTAIDQMKKGASTQEKGSLAGILDIASGITGIVSAAIAAGKAVVALFGLFDKDKGRDLVVSFADTFGGFDKLHDQLLTLGDAGEALWVKLTQGVGRNNPQQAQQVIDEITAALAKQAQGHDDATQATEEQAAATIETATQASLALDTLGGKIDDNEAQWATWASSVNADIASVGAGLKNLTLPSPTGGSTPAPNPTGEGAAVTVPVVLQVSGETIARHVVKTFVRAGL